MVCFVFRGKAACGSDEDADCGVLCVQGTSGMLTVVCFVFRSKAECRQWCALCSGVKRNADSGMLCVQGKSGKRQ